MSKVQDTPSFLLLHRFSSSDYAELTEHSCFTDYARNLNGFGLTAIGLAHSHSSFRGDRHDRQVEFPFIPCNPMNNYTPSYFLIIKLFHFNPEWSLQCIQVFLDANLPFGIAPYIIFAPCCTEVIAVFFSIL